LCRREEVAADANAARADVDFGEKKTGEVGAIERECKSRPSRAGKLFNVTFKTS
jgi:hypothetical protein